MSDSSRKHAPRRREHPYASDNAVGWCPPARKTAYPTKADARRAVRRVRSEPGCIDGHLLNAYPCGDHWHIGHRRAA